MPGVADALNLRPTETVNSPTYASDRQQIFAPQYLMPGNPVGHTAGITKGALTGVGKLTSGDSLSQFAGLAATGGLIAPLAGASAILGGAGAVMGAKGVYSGLKGAGKAYLYGNPAEGDEQLGETIPNALMMLPLGIEAGRHVPEIVRRSIAGDINEPIPGMGGMTPASRFAAVKRLGINPNAADATNSPILQMVRRGNEGSAAGGHIYEKTKGANIEALTAATNDTLDAQSPSDPETSGRYIMDQLQKPFIDLQNRADDSISSLSPLGREQGGARLQSILKSDQQDLYQRGGDQEQAIRDQYGDMPIASYDPMRSTARTILQQNAPVDQLVPHLQQKQTRGIMQDIAKLGQPQPAPPGSAFSILDAVANPDRPQGVQSAAPRPTVGDLLDMRTRLMDAQKNNNELVKGSAAADIDQQVGATHQSIERTLPPEGNEDWLKANEIWRDMKETYDDPSSPFYHAVRTPTPSTLVEGVGGPSPEGVAALQKRAGDEGVGIVARGVGEKMLGRTNTGEYDLGNFGARFERTPEGYRQALFGDQHDPLQKIGQDYQQIAPLRKAAYDTPPEKLVQGVGPQTGSAFRDIAPLIGERGVGAVQRGVTEKLLRTDRNDQFNFPTFAGKLNNLPGDYQAALFGEGPGGGGRLHDIGTAANMLDFNPNRSGTGHQVQKMGEVGSMLSAPGSALALGMTGHPVLAAGAVAGPGAYNAAQYGVARMMNSPRFVDWLMTPRQRPNPFSAPEATAAALGGRKKATLYGK